MGEEEKKDEEKNIENERQELTKLGVGSTWDLLSSGEKNKKKEPEKKTFIGFN